MRYIVSYTWDGFTIYREKSRRFSPIASFDDAATADAVCRDLNKYAE